MESNSNKLLPRWLWLLIGVVLLLSSIPAIVGSAQTPSGSTYLGVQWNIDDHAVYAAWMKQAQEGRLLFENRFTTDEQPGATIHLYFWLLGTLSKVTGISLAMHLGRLLFAAFALIALFRLVSRLTTNDTVRFLSMTLGVFGGGLGWMLWRRYGHEGPIDVWQPEAFLFPSLLTNGLFMASLWLILVVFNKMIAARDSWWPVVAGAIALLALTNIHTYDTLLIALISLAWLVSMIASRTATVAWVLRCLVIAVGALPAVGWFVYVRSIDPVFLERANTPTPSPPPMSVLYGLLPLLILAVVAMLADQRKDRLRVRWQPVVLYGAFLVAVVVACTSTRSEDPYALAPFLICFALALAVCATFRTRNVALGLFFAWAVIALIALYYPGLFQRKLGMMLALPYGVLAGIGLAFLLARIRSVPIRTVSAGAIVLVLSLTSIRWIQRELEMIYDDVSNTTVHRVFLDKDSSEILRLLLSRKVEGQVLLARPGVPIRLGDDKYDVAIPDLNPILTGWAGVKTYAGHWSETPRYNERREELSRNLFNPETSTSDSIRELIKKSGATYVVLPVQPELAAYVVPLKAFEGLSHEVLYKGDTFALLHIE
jgi:arabinosyltransferase C